MSEWRNTGDDGEQSWNFLIDVQGNLYAVIKAFPSGFSWNAFFQRFARFNPPAEATVETPKSDQSVNNNPTFTDPSKIALKASIFKGPDGYRATGSRWRVFRKANPSSTEMSAMADIAIYDKPQTSAPYDTHTLATTLPDGEYDWQMTYDWEYASVNETVTGSTNWSSLTPFAVEKSVVEEDPDEKDPEEKSSGGGGGGCSTFGLGIGLFALAGLVSLKKRSRCVER
jgi:hypothetical protein